MHRVTRVYVVIGILFLATIVFLNFTRHTEPFTDKPLRVGLLGIFKNEGMVIREWVDHYKWQGVDAILLLDNNSTDNYREVLQGTENYVTVLEAKKPNAQAEHYNTLGLPWCKEKGIDILIISDIDEYYFVKDGRLLADYLREKFAGPNPPAELYTHWTMFGSSNHVKQPSGIRYSFTWRMKELGNMAKSIVYVPYLEQIDCHRHKVRGNSICADGDLQLNHYAIMSKEYFENVKMTRGDAWYQVNVRDWKYFKEYDHRDEEDYTLRDRLFKAAETSA